MQQQQMAHPRWRGRRMVMVFQHGPQVRWRSLNWQSFGTIALMSLLLLLVTGRTASAGLGGSPVTSPAGGPPGTLKLVDVNGDGKLDAIALHDAGANVS